MPRRMAREPQAPASPTNSHVYVAAPPAAPAKSSKTEFVLDLLRREEGATVAEVTSAINWLPHSARAFMTGLRKKGHMIEKRGEVTCYHLAATKA